jgi:tetratricopeptide (TPR) repeat protein
MLVPLLLIMLMGISWYLLVSENVKTDNEYNSFLADARRFANIGVTPYAIENYKKALDINPSPDIYVEVADYYESQGESRDQLDWCKNFFEKYPTEPKAYDALLKVYYSDKAYESCFDVINVAIKRNVSTDYLKTISKEIEYVFSMDFNNYDDVSIYANGYSAVKKGESWGFIDSFGKLIVSTRYQSVGVFTVYDFAPVVNLQGEAFFIDKKGERILASKDPYISYSPILSDLFAAKKETGKYVYVDLDFNVLHGEYDYATTMNYDVAAVQIGGAWKIIDKSGAELIATAYTDVIRDEKDIVYRNERLFVSLGDGYIMIDSAGNRIGNQVYEDAKLFSDTTYAAVKINGEWCFVDGNGALKSDKKNEDARSFMNGMAAVQVSGKWGFVDENEELKIAAEYDGAKDFNEKGSCFVKNGEIWQLLKLYRLNRKG